MTLLEAIETLAASEPMGWATKVDDGADTWDLFNLYDAIFAAERDDDIVDDHVYALTHLGIVRCKSDDYLESIPAYRLLGELDS